MAREFIGDLCNGGYIRALESLSAESGANSVAFATDYASGYGVSIGAVLLFGVRGGAVTKLLHLLAAEKSHGMHRHVTAPDPRWSQQASKRWHDAENIINWPTIADDEGQEVLMDVPEEQRHLPEGVGAGLREMWRRNPALRDYAGTKRLTGDIPCQIIEDVLDMLVQKEFSPLDEIEKARYNRIVEQANQQGIDPFYALYNSLFADNDRWRPLWNRARKRLHDYSLLFWESQNELWLAEGKRRPASGVVYRPKSAVVHPPENKTVPGTIYLNNGRYWWVVKNKMKPRPLIDPQSKRKVPGTIFQDDGRYYWVIAGVVGRQRLVPKGEKFSARSRATAEKVAYQKWQRLRRENPSLAAYILSRRRAQGLATKDRALAEKIAARLWRQIQRDDPQLAAQIRESRRPPAQDHWYAHLGAGATQRHIGSYTSKADAQAAYAREFEATYGYPPGYNVQCQPKLDKVWPAWEEEKARLEQMREHPRMPVIGQPVQTEPLAPLIGRMQKVDWLVRNVMLVFDENSPAASRDIAIQSRGTRWYEEIRKQGSRPIIRGSASIDRDTGRIRITVYRQGFDDRRVLAEEVYHIGFKIIRYSCPAVFAAIQRWYRNRLANGGDPTFSLPDVFSCTMAQEDCGIRTSLPRPVIKHAQRLLSTADSTPDAVLQKVKAGWSLSVSEESTVASAARPSDFIVRRFLRGAFFISQERLNTSRFCSRTVPRWHTQSIGRVITIQRLEVIPMEVIKAQVNPKLLSKAERLFTGTLDGRIIEILQNARRAGATEVHIANEDGRVTVRDNGRGIADFSALLDLGRSGWDERLENAEDPAGVGIFCLSPRAVHIRSGRKVVTFTEKTWRGEPVPVQKAEESLSGTMLVFRDNPWIFEVVEKHAVFTGLHVIVDGKECASEPFVSEHAVPHPELGCKIEVRERTKLSPWHGQWKQNWHADIVLVNFHGQVVSFTYAPVGEYLQYLVDLTGELTGIRMMLPRGRGRWRMRRLGCSRPPSRRRPSNTSKSAVPTNSSSRNIAGPRNW